MNNSASSIFGVVLVSEPDQQAQLQHWLAAFTQIQQIDFVADEQSLRTRLRSNNAAACPVHPAFIIVIVSKKRPVVPACVLRYPDAQILVLTRSRKTGEIDRWTEQGAHDVASLKKPDAVQRALQRLIRQCDTARQMRYLQYHNSELVVKVAALQQQRLHDIQSELTRSCNGLPDRSAMTAGVDRLLRGAVMEQRYFVALISVASAVGGWHGNERIGDEQDAGDRDSGRCVATWPEPDEQTELHLYRIANRLQAELSTDMLLGTVAANRLLLIQPTNSVECVEHAVQKIRNLLKRQHCENRLLRCNDNVTFQLQATAVQANTCTADQITEKLVARAQSFRAAARATTHTSSTTDATV